MIAWAIEQGQTADNILNMPIYYPTLEEGLKSALTQICEAVGSATPPDRNYGSIPGA
jgi:dihydrolipoamide dehydrogenase